MYSTSDIIVITITNMLHDVGFNLKKAKEVANTCRNFYGTKSIPVNSAVTIEVKTNKVMKSVYAKLGIKMDWYP